MDRRSQQSPARSCRGITLLEMITVMGIAAILMAIAVPSYKYVTNSNRIAAEVNGLLGDMQFARGEAIKEGQTVTVCVSTDGATCATGTTTWNSGWLVFSDPNNNQQVDPNESILRVQAVFTGSDTFVASNNISAVTFNREGFAAANGGVGLASGTALITLHASPAVAASTRCLSMNMVGMMAVQTPITAGAACL
jgi:type IV fimbrial biogenesis protein FimT